MYEHKLKNIETATEDALIESLHTLWGVKLASKDSKEAYTSEWVLAALSDLKGRLQDRDIVRFLQGAAEGSLKPSTSNSERYSDRYLTPKAINMAIGPCSKKKIDEIETEVLSLKGIFGKFRGEPKNKRLLPFQIEAFGITSIKADILEQQGYLLEYKDEGYYMPEIIRYGLEFSYKSRGKTKVLQMLRKANENSI